ncbi:unnamed protein product, partial [marine sediment metagenome]
LSGDPITDGSITGITGPIIVQSNGDLVANLEGVVNYDGTDYPIKIDMNLDFLGTSTVLVTEIVEEPIVAISVTPTSIDFGTLYPGQSSDPAAITVTNIGTVGAIDVTALLEPETGTVFDYLQL